MTGRHHADTADLDFVGPVVRFVAGQRAVTVKAVRDALGLSKGDADQALAELFELGLVGEASRGRGRLVLFTPPAEVSATELAEADQLARTVLGVDYGEPGASESVEWPGSNGGLKAPDVPGDSPFSDPVVPPDPFTDSAGNQWPTRDPFTGA